VTLANRRGNEIRLRDQDQALVVRSLQQFHAMAGTRIYSGMVQRDAQLLQTQMVSDGKVWDSGLQSTYEEPLPDTANLQDPVLKRGFLAPSARVLRKRTLANGELSRAVLPLEPHLDPYQFLQRGGFINSKGFVVDDRHQSDAVYGGKPVFRVAAQSPKNALREPDRDTLTEYRIEVTHTSDGRLPVTEQTDMFDAERLPPQGQGAEQEAGNPSNRPFIEWVLGSVVGNDPFSNIGRDQYGVPLVLSVFDGDQPNPRIAPAKLVASRDTGESPTPVEEHAATLFRLRPPAATSGAPETFWSVNKKAQFKAALGGPTNENSAEIALSGGLKLAVGGEVGLLFNGGIKLGSQAGTSSENVGVDLDAGTGAVRITGSGKISGNERTARRADGTEASTPSVLVKAEGTTRLEATQLTEIQSPTTKVVSENVNVSGQQAVNINSASAVQVSGEEVTTSSTGKMSQTYSGPKGQNPTNGPLHERTYSSTIPGLTAEEVTYEAGSRKESFTLGNHETEIKVGNMTYRTLAGTFTAQAGANSLQLGQEGMTATVATGNISLDASAGAASFTGFAGVTLSSKGGATLVEGALGVFLRAPVSGPNQGSIVCGGSLEPFTGLPFSTWAIGAPLHQVTSN
jgi:hypothetical protein